jgi:hypothetical protein
LNRNRLDIRRVVTFCSIYPVDGAVAEAERETTLCRIAIRVLDSPQSVQQTSESVSEQPIAKASRIRGIWAESKQRFLLGML